MEQYFNENKSSSISGWLGSGRHTHIVSGGELQEQQQDNSSEQQVLRIRIFYFQYKYKDLIKLVLLK